MGVQRDSDKVRVVSKAVETVATSICDDVKVLVQKYGFTEDEGEAVAEDVYSSLEKRLFIGASKRR